MKKKLLSILLILCFVCSSLVGCQSGDEESSANTEQESEEEGIAKWKLEYAEILLEFLCRTERARTHMGEFRDYNTCNFTLLDVNKDGKPELFVGKTDNDMTEPGEYHLFTDKKQFDEDPTYPIAGIREAEKEIVFFESYNMENPIYMGKIKWSRLDIEFAFWMYEEGVEYRISHDVLCEDYYKYDNKAEEISEEEYNELLEKYSEKNLMLLNGEELTLENLESALGISFSKGDRGNLEDLLLELQDDPYMEKAGIVAHVMDIIETAIDNLENPQSDKEKDDADKDDADKEDSEKDDVAEEESEEVEKVEKEKIEFVISQIDVNEYPKVRVYFHLEDLNGNPLENLDFGTNKIRITEADGTPTWADVLQAEQIKEKSISFVIDISGSMLDDDKYIYAQQAISALLDNMQMQGDYAASLLAFNDTQNMLEDFSKDYTNLRAELQSVQPSGGTAFWDSLELALIKANTQPGQKCVIAATDGMDNSSRTTKENVLALSKQLQIPIYIIAFDEQLAIEMAVFAQNTGGNCFTIDDINNLMTIYQTIFVRQENQMMLEFISDGNTEETDRELELSLELDEYEANAKIPYHKVDELYANTVTNDIIVSVSASSHLEEYYESTGHLYHVAENVLDGSFRTAWVENASGNGVGEWIQLDFDSNHVINGIEISNGYKKSESLYAKNSRASKVRLHFSDGSSQDFSLEDRFIGVQRLTFATPIVTNYIRIELLEMYPGTKYEDTCITELSVY